MSDLTNDVNGDAGDNPKAPANTPTESKTLVKAESKNDALLLGSAINHLNLLDEKDVVIAEAFLTKIMRSEKGGFKTISDGLAILMRAQDLALPFSSCIEHIHVINGKTGLDIHIIKALLSKAACTWETIKDYQALYEYTDGINVYCDGQLPDYCVRCISKQEAESLRETDKENDKVYVYPVKWYADFNGNKYKEYQLSSKKHKVVSTKAEAIALAQQGIIGIYRIPNVAIDYVTEYKFYRTRNGKETTAIGRYSYTEALAAELFEKDTYKKYARVMISHRAYTYGAREIASDLLMGASETSELKIVHGIPLSPQDVEYVEI